MVNVKTILLLLMEKNAINAIMKMLECQDVKVNVLSHWIGRIQFYAQALRRM